MEEMTDRFTVKPPPQRDDLGVEGFGWPHMTDRFTVKPPPQLRGQLLSGYKAQAKVSPGYSMNKHLIYILEQYHNGENVREIQTTDTANREKLDKLIKWVSDNTFFSRRDLLKVIGE